MMSVSMRLLLECTMDFQASKLTEQHLATIWSGEQRIASELSGPAV